MSKKDIDKRYVIVTGGELRNKGAQAMTFIVVDEIAKRYPDKTVVLISSYDYIRSEEVKKNYKFLILPLLKKANRSILYTRSMSYILSRIFKKSMLRKYYDVFTNAALWLDISGYALGESWGAYDARQYMTRVILPEIVYTVISIIVLYKPLQLLDKVFDSRKRKVKDIDETIL